MFLSDRIYSRGRIEMNFPVAMMVFGIFFVVGALAFGKIMAFLGVRKFIEKNEKPNIKPR